MSKYKVGDKVLLQGKVFKIEEDNIPYPYGIRIAKNVEFMFCEQEMISKTYEDGLNDAWELVEKILEMPIGEREMALSIDEHYLEDILVRLKPQEALKRLEAYEESKAIKVGDVVYADGVQGVVIDIISDEGCYIYNENGCIEEHWFKDLKKTGRHIDIEHLLEQIRGNE